MREVGMQSGGPRYLNAYLNGIQFVLLAIEGKLASMPDPVAKADVMEAMREYHELAMRLRDRIRARSSSADAGRDIVEPRVQLRSDDEDDDLFGVPR